jgi:hypothetical protein
MKNSINPPYSSPLHDLEHDEWLEELRAHGKRRARSPHAAHARQRHPSGRTSRPAFARPFPVLPFAYDFGARCHCPPPPAHAAAPAHAPAPASAHEPAHEPAPAHAAAPAPEDAAPAAPDTEHEFGLGGPPQARAQHPNPMGKWIRQGNTITLLGLHSAPRSRRDRAHEDEASLPWGPVFGGTPAASPQAAPPGSELHRILRVMHQKGYVVYTEPHRLNIVGVRDPNPVSNSFDDAIHLFFKDEAGNWIVKKNPATTDAGRTYLLKPMNSKGTAILVPGQYVDSHKLGLHRGQYTALVQQKPVTVMRDNSQDDRLDFKAPLRETGLFGINIHRATASGTSRTVDSWSAGCQVFANSSDFAQFISWCQKHSNLYGNNFTYTLLSQEEL